MAGRIRNKVRRKRSPWASTAFGSAGFTVGAPGAAVVTQIQLKDDNGNNVSGVFGFNLYLSDVNTGVGLVATAPSGAVAASTNGTVTDDGGGTKKSFFCTTNATGRVDISIANTGAKTMYPCLVMPDGSVLVGTPIITA